MLWKGLAVRLYSYAYLFCFRVFYTSLSQQQISQLKLSSLDYANTLLKYLKSVKDIITYKKQQDADIVTMEIFLDASFNVCKNVSSGQTGVLSALAVETRSTLFHPLDWSRWKKVEFARFSFEAEILAAVETNDGGYYITCATKTRMQLPK